MSQVLLTFTLTVTSTVHQTIVLGDDGVVSRVNARPGDTENPEVGWWQGSIDGSVLALAQSLATSAWPDITASRPPAAAAWSATGAGGRRGLWGATDEIGAALRSLQSECSKVARDAVAVAALSARQSGADGPVMLTVESRGTAPIDLSLRDAEFVDGETTVFITDEAEVVGYLGAALSLPPELRAVGVLRNRQSGTQGLDLTGTMSSGAERYDVGLRVTVTTE
ncbi:hypothetical protein [Nocardioides sp. WS12]|uniref:hypothetical protein n=1 Tax=Nocardioides sp. WS12 TaxID=2486272 RepID=UPI0015FC2CE8|nr:hypothetical protein [Nocardioides sp. WS12]